jgi:membrane-associated phospholipid phosphatase
MPAIIALDHRLTERIRRAGATSYAFWRLLAGQFIAVYVLAAIVLAYLGQLELWRFLASFGLAYLVANLCQVIIKRQRPNFKQLTGYKMLFHSYSYPSAHATLSASSALALCLLLPSSAGALMLIVAILGAMLALLIGLSRVMVGVHYFGDVVSGWGLGIVVAWVYIGLLTV